MKSNSPSAQQGFTLLELLTSMSLLVLIVLMMSRVFTDTTLMWNLGTKRVTEAQEARVVVEFLSREISMAIADERVSFKVHSETSSSNLSVAAYGDDTDSICFVSTPRTPRWDDVRRAASQYVYYVNYMRDPRTGDILNEDHEEGPRYQLARRRLTRSMHSFASVPASVQLPDRPNQRIFHTAYMRKDWWLPPLVTVSPEEMVAENIIAFEIWAQPQHYPAWQGYNFDSTYVPQGGDRPLGAPLWIDLYLEFMGHPEIVQYGLMWQQNHPDLEDFRERNVRRYSTRIYFRNREKMTL